MESMNYQCVEGINYLTFGFVSDVAKHLDITSNLEMREDDIICVGFPRAGNHWVYEVVNMIIHQDTKFAEKLFYTTVLELMGKDIVQKMEAMPSPRYLSTHHRVQRLPRQATEKSVKIIYLMRNPKDALASMYRLLTSFKDPNQQFGGSWNEFFELQMKGEFPWGSWFDHVLSMETFIEDHPENPVYIFSFEKMKLNPTTVIGELCSFLGMSCDLAQAIATETDFTHMKKTLREGKMKMEESLLKEDSDALFKKGEIGGWRDRFTVAQSERFDQLFCDKMVKSKLADLVKDYL